ncbi:uncharacterized protein BJX67DRAFT_367747 [Aspergillus lucknowensis]|uniref:BZIP domain-containing protein n=1 Tax=Aspergillus lucknowensis TaxID=176173 RepID=A0ABR4LBM6_9EURO
MSPSPSFDVSANHRTKEENQERAFIAASRRKDRSLDARIESANRASALHKNRTGRALHITRQIVESEAMYEEVDSNYQAKLQRMMQAQTMQLEQDFERKLFVAMRNHPQALHQRRANSFATQGPLHGGRKMSLDLSQLRGSLPDSMASPVGKSNFSPKYSFIPQGPQSQSQAPTQMGSYVASGTPTWTRPDQQHLMQPWDGVYGNSMSPSMVGGLPMPTLPFRDRLASAPTIPVHGQAGPISATPSMTSRGTGQNQHLRVRSEPGSITVPTATPSSASPSSYSSLQRTAPYASSPSVGPSSSSELLPTPDPCASPHTPVSQVSEPTTNPSGLDLVSVGPGPEKWSTDLLHELDLNLEFEIFPHEPADQDYLDFSQFASTLDNGHIAHSQTPAHMQMQRQIPVQFDPSSVGAETSMDDLPDMDEYTASL